MATKPASSSALFDLPTAPDYRVAWSALCEFEWVRDLYSCPQDAVHHAEGDVGIHTLMVLETLVAMPAWRALSEDDKRATFWGCLLHDVGKPSTTKIESDGRVTAKGHSRRGELMARKILWEAGAPFELRELVCGLIRFHQVPFFLIERDDATRVAAEISLTTRCDLLAIVAEADIRGRVCADASRVIDNIELFRAYTTEQGCFTQARSFPSDHSRFMYFRSEGRSPDVELFDDSRCEVVIMSGLPGSGKDTYLRENRGSLPIVSLDGLREELDIGHDENQGIIVQTARERAREYLRRGESFAWNATNLSRQFRAPLIGLCADYKARVRIIYVEVSHDLLFVQNKSRAAVVPERVIRKMQDRWEIPESTEVHFVEHRVRG